MVYLLKLYSKHLLAELRSDWLLDIKHWPPTWPPVRLQKGERPSFAREIKAFRRADSNKRETRILKDFITASNHKIQAYRLVDYIAREAGLPISPPEVYLANVLIGDVDPNKLGPRFVLKPMKGSGNQGVFCVERRGDSFYDSARKQTFSWDELRDRYLEERRIFLKSRKRGQVKRPFSERVFAEEWLQDGVRGDIPLDYRMYCFFGRCGLIQQRDCNLGMMGSNRRSRFYNRLWEDIGEVRGPAGMDPTLPPPSGGDAAVRIAETISSYIPLPFIRVDIYITPQGVRFGEFTPFPGSSAKYDPPTDATLGRMYLDAVRRLQKSRFPERDVLMSVIKDG